MGHARLHSDVIGDNSAPKTAIFLHGILGSGRNWRGFARRLQQDRPDWKVLLVDHRHHGDSEHPAGPHTLEAIAGDLVPVFDRHTSGPTILIGHSFGGKVGLKFAQLFAERLSSLWLLDSNPGIQHVDFGRPERHQVLYVLSALRRIPGPFASRDEAVATLTGSGLSEPLSRWLVLNLEEKNERWHWKIEPDAIEEMLRAYFAENLWPVLEDPSPIARNVAYGARSDRWSTGNRERLESNARAGNISLHEIADAGHWLHSDNPEGLAEAMSASFDELA